MDSSEGWFRRQNSVATVERNGSRCREGRAAALALTTPPNPNPGFGLYNASGSPRTMQLAVKLLF
jgi:hypothetical protein